MKGKALKPNLGHGTKEEKRNKKRQRLVEQLNQKREAQAAAREYVAPPQLEDATVGREMYDILGMIQRTPIAVPAPRQAPPDEREVRMRAIAQMQADLAQPALLTNPDAMFDATWEQLRARALANPPRPPVRKSK
jgi:chromatin segregation and condensation protein Rec8/ScpA/Scc1 (kleisin family)